MNTAAIDLGGPVPAPPEGLCLDFVNTRCWRGQAHPDESLHAPADLLAWCGKTLPQAASGALHRWWQAHPAEAEAAFGSALAVREALFRLCDAVVDGKAPPPDALHVVDAALEAAPRRLGIAAQGAALGWRTGLWRPGMAALLAPVLWSAADLLAGPRLRRMRLCANPECRWVFLDDSKSGTRRWCDMSACGNRAKARRHYLRHKAG